MTTSPESFTIELPSLLECLSNPTTPDQGSPQSQESFCSLDGGATHLGDDSDYDICVHSLKERITDPEDKGMLEYPMLMPFQF